jgi:hypothetical protein
MLTGETRSTHSNNGPNAAYFTIIPKSTDQVLNLSPTVRGRQLSARAMARPSLSTTLLDSFYNDMFTTERTNGPIIYFDCAAFM